MCFVDTRVFNGVIVVYTRLCYLIVLIPVLAPIFNRLILRLHCETFIVLPVNDKVLDYENTIVNNGENPQEQFSRIAKARVPITCVDAHNHHLNQAEYCTPEVREDLHNGPATSIFVLPVKVHLWRVLDDCDQKLAHAEVVEDVYPHDLTGGSHEDDYNNTAPSNPEANHSAQGKRSPLPAVDEDLQDVDKREEETVEREDSVVYGNGDLG